MDDLGARARRYTLAPGPSLAAGVVHPAATKGDTTGGLHTGPGGIYKILYHMVIGKVTWDLELFQAGLGTMHLPSQTGDLAARRPRGLTESQIRVLNLMEEPPDSPSTNSPAEWDGASNVSVIT